MEKETFEYKIIDINIALTINTYIETLNEAGKDGWELCGFSPYVFRAIFKRKITSTNNIK